MTTCALSATHHFFLALLAIYDFVAARVSSDHLSNCIFYLKW